MRCTRLRVDDGQSFSRRSQFTAPVSHARPFVDEAVDERQQALVASLAIGATRPGSSAASDKDGSPQTSFGSESGREIVFCLPFGERFPEDLVLPDLAAAQPYQPAHRSSRARTSELPTTTELIAAGPPSLTRRRQGYGTITDSYFCIMTEKTPLCCAEKE